VGYNQIKLPEIYLSKNHKNHSGEAQRLLPSLSFTLALLDCRRKLMTKKNRHFSGGIQGGPPTPTIYHRGHRDFARSPAVPLDFASRSCGFLHPLA